MALHYNLAKVYAISENDPDFVHQIVKVFVLDTPIDLDHIKLAIEEKNHQKVIHSLFFSPWPNLGNPKVWRDSCSIWLSG